MNPYKIGDRVRAQRSIGGPHEPAEVIATPVHVMPKTLPSGCHQAGGDQEAAAQLDAAGQQRNRLGTGRVSLVPTDTLCWHSRPRVPKTITRKTIYKRLVDDVSGGFS